MNTLEIDKTQLMEAVTVAASLANAKTFSDLDHVLIGYYERDLVISASNMEHSFGTALAVDEAFWAEGRTQKVWVRGKDLATAVAKSGPLTSLTFAANELKVGRYTLPTRSVVASMDMQRLEAGACLTNLPTAILLDLVATLCWLPDTDDPRPSLKGIHLEIKVGHLIASAIRGNSMVLRVEYDLDAGDCYAQGPMIIPAKSLELLAKHLKPQWKRQKNKPDVRPWELPWATQIAWGESHWGGEKEEARVIGRLINGTPIPTMDWDAGGTRGWRVNAVQFQELLNNAKALIKNRPEAIIRIGDKPVLHITTLEPGAGKYEGQLLLRGFGDTEPIDLWVHCHQLAALTDAFRPEGDIYLSSKHAENGPVILRQVMDLDIGGEQVVAKKIIGAQVCTRKKEDWWSE